MLFRSTSEIPRGRKNNVYFVISNEANLHRLKNSERCKYWDDCGAWTKHHGALTYHDKTTLTELRKLPNGLFGQRKRVDGHDTVVELGIQPEVITVHRFYARLKRDLKYRRRVTVMSDSNLYVAEYLGTFPDAVESHGNATKSASEYVRTNPQTLSNIQQRCKTSNLKPRKIYDQLESEATDEVNGPRDQKQVENMAAQVKVKSQMSSSSSNIADEMQTLCSLVVSDDFVQSVRFEKSHAPCVILYTKQQLEDVRRLCGKSSPSELRSVLAVDRTFNVSSLYVTLTVYKQRRVVRKSTGDAPIFVGPIMLHGDGKYETYLGFFSHLFGALKGDLQSSELRSLDGMLTGSDEEKALVTAVHDAFPNSQHLFCMIHCKDNARHHLKTIGVPKNLLERLLLLLFAADGLAGSGDEHSVDNKTAEIMQFIRQNNIDAADYIHDRIIPKIVNNCQLKWSESWLGQHQWTNNNCESANHVLKMEIDWKPARLTDLVDHLRDLVRLQFADLRRSLCGLGDFQVTSSYARHVVPQMQWSLMSDERRDQHLQKFLADMGPRTDHRTVTSSDGLLTVTGSPRIARKKNQRQRPKSSRTLAFK